MTIATIALARTEGDFQKVRQFWYQIYCVLRGVLRDEADHLTHELNDSLLTKGKLLMALDANGEMIGSMLMTYARSSDLGSYFDFYELEKLPTDLTNTAIVTKFMVTPERRGTQLPIALLKEGMRVLIQDEIHCVVYDANPPTDSLFKRLGGIDWLGPKTHPVFGNVRVMMSRLKEDREIFSHPSNPLASCYQDLNQTEKSL
jgi:hypothetical protein